MADRFGASSLTALLAVAGMVGVGVVSYRALNATPAICETAEACPLMGDDCSMSCGEKTSCCAEEKAAKTSCCAEESTGAILAVSETAETKACKELTEGCTGDGKNGCCGGCAEGKEACSTKSSCSEKTECATEKVAGEEKKACCKQGS